MVFRGFEERGTGSPTTTVQKGTVPFCTVAPLARAPRKIPVGRFLAKLRQNGEMGADEPAAETKPTPDEDAQLTRMLGKLKTDAD